MYRSPPIDAAKAELAAMILSIKVRRSVLFIEVSLGFGDRNEIRNGQGSRENDAALAIDTAF
jgi:hypothetical protein